MIVLKVLLCIVAVIFSILGGLRLMIYSVATMETGTFLMKVVGMVVFAFSLFVLAKVIQFVTNA